VNDRPDAGELISISRETFASEVLPALPEKLRYTGLMIANALAIAQRELEAGDAPKHSELERLRVFLRESPVPLTATALRSTLERYKQRIAREIRAGRFDGPERIAMFEHLRQTTADKLAVSNPKVLDRE